MKQPPRRLAALAAAACLAGLATPGWALYKVVGADGKVTYTDRPPLNEPGKVTNLSREFGAAAAGPADNGAGAASTSLASLPIEVRQAAQKFPVTLYASPDCAPCDQGRRLLSERGIPYSEKRVSSEEDADALAKATGVRTVPVLMVGGQAVRGWADSEWHLTLDTAGYPRESRLPKAYVPPTPTTVAERKAKPAPAPKAPAPAPEVTDAPPPVPDSKDGIRF